MPLAVDGWKQCSACKETKPVAEFHRSTSSPDGLRGNCRSCVRAQNISWRKRNPEKKRAQNRRSQRVLNYTKFGLTEATYLEMLAAQGGGCAICGAPPGVKRLHIDHDHSCCPGQFSCGPCVRGLLCSNCNTAIGLMREDPARLAGAIAYLNK